MGAGAHEESRRRLGGRGGGGVAGACQAQVRSGRLSLRGVRKARTAAVHPPTATVAANPCANERRRVAATHARQVFGSNCLVPRRAVLRSHFRHAVLRRIRRPLLRRRRLRVREHEREHLYGLAEAHLIREDAAAQALSSHVLRHSHRRRPTCGHPLPRRCVERQCPVADVPVKSLAARAAELPPKAFGTDRLERRYAAQTLSRTHPFDCICLVLPQRRPEGRQCIEWRSWARMRRGVAMQLLVERGRARVNRRYGGGRAGCGTVQSSSSTSQREKRAHEGVQIACHVAARRREVRDVRAQADCL